MSPQVSCQLIMSPRKTKLMQQCWRTMVERYLRSTEWHLKKSSCTTGKVIPSNSLIDFIYWYVWNTGRVSAALLRTFARKKLNDLTHKINQNYFFRALRTKLFSDGAHQHKILHTLTSEFTWSKTIYKTWDSEERRREPARNRSSNQHTGWMLPELHAVRLTLHTAQHTYSTRHSTRRQHIDTP